MQRIIDILHEGRERSRLRSLRDEEVHLAAENVTTGGLKDDMVPTKGRSRQSILCRTGPRSWDEQAPTASARTSYARCNMQKPTDSSRNAPLGNRKDRAIAALLKHGSKEKAAEEAGVHPATLWRWQKDPNFQQAIREGRREAFSQCVGRLQQASTTAVETLLGIMTDQAAPSGSRVRAAQCVVELSQKRFELEDLEVRISNLEQTKGKDSGSERS